MAVARRPPASPSYGTYYAKRMVRAVTARLPSEALGSIRHYTSTYYDRVAQTGRGRVGSR